MRIETGRLILRRWQERDRAPFSAMNGDPRVMEFFPECLTRAASDALVDRIEAHFESHGFGLLAAELRDSGAFIGFIGLSIPAFTAAFTPCVEIGWRLAAEYWGRGLATEGAREVLSYAFRDLALREVVSFTAPGNVRSRRVMERIGLRRDPASDFDHPRLPEGHPLRPQVLYRIAREEWLSPAKLSTTTG